MKLRVLILFLLLSFNKGFCDRGEDSIRNIINTSTSDSIKIVSYSNLCFIYANDPESILGILSEMKNYCETLTNENWKALCLRKIGVFYNRMHYFDKGIEYTLQSAALFEKINNKEGLANCYSNLGTMYNGKAELTNDKAFFDRAISYHLKCIELRKELKDTATQIQNSYLNLGSTYVSSQNYEKALECYNKAYYVYSKVTNDYNGIQLVSLSLGELYLKMAMKERKPEYFKRSYEYFRSVQQQYSATSTNERYIITLIRIGQILCETGKLNDGMGYLLEGFKLSTQIKHKGNILDAADQLVLAYEKKGDYKQADEYLHIYNSVKDSLINEKNRSSTEQMQALYQSSQKDREIEHLNAANEVQNARLNRQRVVIFSSIGGLALILILAFVLLTGYNNKKKANLKLAEAYGKIETKNRQITDSINYSKRIQNAILPPIHNINQHLSNFFVFYQPRDIVSGDFYWFTEHKDKLFFIVADCTGHGVPGALMSMIGNTLLNEIINQQNISDPAQILHHLNDEVMKALHQQQGDLQTQEDGLDISICCIDKKTSALKYASANHTLFIKTKNKITELKGDIFSVGGGMGQTQKQFTTHDFTPESGSFIVMSTDGYYDQFGGAKDTKFLLSNFEELILKIDFEKGNPTKEFQDAFENWKGDRKQTDDVLVAGFKL